MSHHEIFVMQSLDILVRQSSDDVVMWVAVMRWTLWLRNKQDIGDDSTLGSGKRSQGSKARMKSSVEVTTARSHIVHLVVHDVDGCSTVPRCVDAGVSRIVASMVVVVKYWLSGNSRHDDHL